jgi:hypothetical protein
MKTFTITINGVSDFMFGKKAVSKKGTNETHDQYEDRVWKEQIHQANGECFIQPFAFKNALESAARWLSMGIPGEGKKTYTKRFASGVLVVDRMLLLNTKGKAVKVDDVEPVRIFAPSDGKRGSGKRVWRIFPTVHDWNTVAVIHVLDDKITEEVLAAHVKAAGQFIGLGSMRVENGGINGRFDVVSIEQLKDAIAA